MWEHRPPHETLAWLRANDPVSWWPLHDGDGFWAVALHQDVLAVSRDVATFSSRGGVISYEDLPAEQADARRTMLEEDPPRHTALRGLVNRDFLPRQVARHEATLRRLVAGTIERAATARRSTPSPPSPGRSRSGCCAASSGSPARPPRTWCAGATS